MCVCVDFYIKSRSGIFIWKRKLSRIFFQNGIFSFSNIFFLVFYLMSCDRWQLTTQTIYTKKSFFFPLLTTKYRYKFWQTQNEHVVVVVVESMKAESNLNEVYAKNKKSFPSYHHHSWRTRKQKKIDRIFRPRKNFSFLSLLESSHKL